MDETGKRMYSDGHLWLEIHGDEALVGLTELALEELENVTFVELPAIGAKIKKDDVLFVLESNKASGDFMAPVDGVVTKTNTVLAKDTTLINQSPEKLGWICGMKLSDLSQTDSLMDEKDYMSEFGPSNETR